jgi:RNA 3'-terminal phosphate cyclase (ATP)
MRRSGLTAEDLTFIQIVQKATQAEVSGDDLNSEDLLFTPKKSLRGVTGKFDVGSHMEGRVPGGTLILAAAAAPLLARGLTYSSLTLSGETFTSNALSFDAFERSTAAAWRAQGMYVFPSLVSTGFGHGTRGEVHLDVEPSGLEPIDWAVRGELVSVGAVVTATDMAAQVAERARAQLSTRTEGLGVEPDYVFNEIHGVESGLSVTIWAEFERGVGSGSMVLQRGQNLSQAVDGAWDSFCSWFKTKATVDTFLADQILVPAVLTSGRTVFTTPVLTRRLLTMVWVIKQFFPIKITVLGREGEFGTVTIERD